MKTRYIVLLGMAFVTIAIVRVIGVENLRREYLIRTAVPATVTSPTIPWERQQLIGWSYQLQTSNRTANYLFLDWGKNEVLATMGVATNGGAYAVTDFGYRWKIEPNGVLTLAAMDEVMSNETMALVNIGKYTATVWNLSRNESELYIRSPFKR